MKCPFCEKELKPGMMKHTPSYNTKQYWCDCGSVAFFIKGNNKEVESIDINFKED